MQVMRKVLCSQQYTVRRLMIFSFDVVISLETAIRVGQRIQMCPSSSFMYACVEDTITINLLSPYRQPRTNKEQVTFTERIACSEDVTFRKTLYFTLLRVSSLNP
jgi:hypothetical protein